MQLPTIRVIHPRLGPVIVNLEDYLKQPDRYKLPGEVKSAEIKLNKTMEAAKPVEVAKVEAPKADVPKPVPAPVVDEKKGKTLV